MQSHKELKVWQYAIDMAVEIQNVTRSYPKEEIFGMVSQMRRAATSISMNIAEGYARGTDKEILHFLYIASGSASELDTQLILSYRFGFIDAETNSRLSEQLTIIRKMLNSLITSVKARITNEKVYQQNNKTTKQLRKMAKNITVTVKFWKQNGPKDKGHFDEQLMKNVPDDTSFLEMLDMMNEQLISQGKEPFVFDHDCREGICGMCSLYINGTPHGKTERGATTCQLYMRKFNDGDVITVEPWRSAGFPVIKDCMVDRSAFDKIIQAGGYTSIRTGQAQDANAILIPKENADEAMDCATCIGCGACVAACKNGSAMLFVSSKVSQLALLPQGRPEAAKRAKAMIARMDELGFGNCTNTRACEAVCPKNESIANIARLNREFIKAKLAD